MYGERVRLQQGLYTELAAWLFLASTSSTRLDSKERKAKHLGFERLGLSVVRLSSFSIQQMLILSFCFLFKIVKHECWMKFQYSDFSCLVNLFCLINQMCTLRHE